ncbi:hypothetical protein L916_02222 [Phytophthora nicotianae]|uniref:Uncharacterized protein n=1 Tax=Phytophthora nicotianae TaxID=4792 RepID=W2JR86_PHYNI|nr:hypothetical protein L916_02222 [Phytophthora nicotianae]
MASPSHTRAVPARSVARSLADAAAALRAQEWRGDSSNSRVNSSVVPRQMPPYEEDISTSYSARYSVQDEQNGALYDREAFYEELRERHRNLTERQRLAREFFAQNLQHSQHRPWGEENETLRGHNAAKRQRVVTDRSPQRRQPTDKPRRAPPRLTQPVQESGLVISSSIRPETPNSSGLHEVTNAPSVIEDAESEGAVGGAGKKRVRYLRDTDRRNIIKRIENGEKQAALAREFGVTRAAICHIKKNRFEILSRYNTLVKSAQEIDCADNFVGPPGMDMMVHQVRAKSVLLLMTMLRDKRSNGATFRRVAGRLIMILLEETLGVLGTGSVEVITGTGHLYRGLELRHQFCGVAVGTEGFPFLVLFHQMEPEAPQGSIHVQAETDKRGDRVWRLDHMDLPANIAQHKVLLFSSTCSTGNAECKAIEALCSIGCDERSIALVVILVASDGIVNISNRFPQVKIITGGVDGTVDPQTESIVPGFGDFVLRYNGGS